MIYFRKERGERERERERERETETETETERKKHRDMRLFRILKLSKVTPG